MVSENPSFSRLRAIGLPMIPSPISPTRSVMVAQLPPRNRPRAENAVAILAFVYSQTRRFCSDALWRCSVTDQLTVNPFYLRDPYREFLQREGVPVYEDVLTLDPLTLELEPWQRLGGLGAYVHIAGRGDFVSCYVAEIPAGGQLKPEKHLHDEVIYVLSGRGATTIEVPGGHTTFEWGTGSLFAIPLNAP